MPLFSRYDNGKLHSGKWYCGCDEEAKWYTSSQESSKGERFARCKWSGTEKDCKFFLTEIDEPEARLSKSVTVCPSTPKTPRRTVEAMPTPKTGSNPRVNLFSGGSRARRVTSLKDSPTARRFVDADGDDGDLADFVVRQLEQDGINVKSSTKSIIRYAIGSRMGKYEAALQNSNDSLALALQKLDELESGPAS